MSRLKKVASARRASAIEIANEMTLPVIMIPKQLKIEYETMSAQPESSANAPHSRRDERGGENRPERRRRQVERRHYFVGVERLRHLRLHVRGAARRGGAPASDLRPRRKRGRPAYTDLRMFPVQQRRQAIMQRSDAYQV